MFATAIETILDLTVRAPIFRLGIVLVSVGAVPFYFLAHAVACVR